MASDNSQFGEDGQAAIEGGNLSQQGGVGRGEQAAFTPEEQAALRAELIKANPNTVHELIQGATVADLIASVRNAEAAYHQVHERIVAATPTMAGGGVRSVDQAGVGGSGSAMALGKLDAFSKISLGLQQNDAAGAVGGMGMARVNVVGRR